MKQVILNFPDDATLLSVTVVMKEKRNYKGKINRNMSIHGVDLLKDRYITFDGEHWEDEE